MVQIYFAHNSDNIGNMWKCEILNYTYNHIFWRPSDWVHYLFQYCWIYILLYFTFRYVSICSGTSIPIQAPDRRNWLISVELYLYVNNGVRLTAVFVVKQVSAFLTFPSCSNANFLFQYHLIANEKTVTILHCLVPLPGNISLSWYTVTCFATEAAVLIGNWFITILQVVATITYNTVTHLHSLQSVHANIPILFGASGIRLETADR
jgi:hypothetical protein